MKFTNIQQIDSFINAVEKCKGSVWLESIDGDKYNLKSQFSKYLALGALLSEHGEDLELYCSDREDQQQLFKFFSEHPEVYK